MIHKFWSELKYRNKWSPVRIALFAAFICVLYGRYAAGQEASPGAAYQQSLSGNPLSAQPACYLGGAGQSAGASGYNSQMPTGAVSGVQTQGPYGTYSQQGDYTQQGEPYPLDQAQEDEQYQTDQGTIGQAPSQPTMSAEQIISILQQAPDTLLTFKDLAGQRFGVDPSTISDNGIFNCVRQDPYFRSQVAQELVNRGYVANPQLRPETATTAQRTPLANGEMRQSTLAPSFPPLQTRPAEQPSEVRRQMPIPYPNLPSLRDLYSQEVPANGGLRRFGSAAFLFGTGNVNQLPMDLPVGPDYVLGPGDNLILNMWGGQSARLERAIDRQGQIALPEAGTVTIAGLTIAQAQGAIQQALGTQFQNEHVEISLGRVRMVRVYVVGDVQRPGAYDVSSLSTPLNALYAAGGPTSLGSLRTLKQYRGNQLVREVDLYDFLLHGVLPSMDRLLPGDTILVPPVGPQVSVAGMVRRQAIYELKEQADLKDVLNLAGGVLVSADLKEIRVERVVAHEHHTMLRVQIPDSSNGEAAKLPPFQVQDGDSIEVSPILPYNDQVVYLDGHVFKPGPYAWRDGMTVNELVHSYQDVMPEPAGNAEIIRLVPPDLHPETISFNLPDALIGNDPITLQPFDTVRIYGRYDIDPPRVSIHGEVLRPGDYPMSQGMTVAELVRMAGGFRRSAYRQEADLSNYTVQNGQKVLVGYSVVAVQKALDGDKSADVLLKPGDVVGIRQLTGWQDIGASITISGEVTFAGTYGIDEGERLSSVLKRAGGFREDAYPQGALLERVQVRQMEENNRQEMIRRVESSIPSVAAGVSTTPQDQQNLLQTMRQQQQDVVAALRSHPSSGRLVIKISADISKWENTPADVVVRAGDTLTIPKHPDFVLIGGQVFNATGIAYRPGKDAGWYLRQAGGATRSGDKKSIFILRADGSVVGDAKNTLFGPGVLSLRMNPGDSIIVPEKVIGGSQLWRNIIGTAQIMSSVALTGAVAGAF